MSEWYRLSLYLKYKYTLERENLWMYALPAAYFQFFQGLVLGYRIPRNLRTDREH